MKGPNRTRNVTDMPAICLTDGRHILEVCEQAEKMGRGLQVYCTPFGDDKGDSFINLESLVAAVYPETQENTLRGQRSLMILCGTS